MVSLVSSHICFNCQHTHTEQSRPANSNPLHPYGGRGQVQQMLSNCQQTILAHTNTHITHNTHKCTDHTHTQTNTHTHTHHATHHTQQAWLGRQRRREKERRSVWYHIHLPQRLL